LLVLVVVLVLETRCAGSRTITRTTTRTMGKETT
jgi:hypothetical protein